MIESRAMMKQTKRWPLAAGFLLVTAVSLLLLAFFLQTSLTFTAGSLGAPLDDAWIHFQFARNLANGAGFSFNPGEPAPGSTAPLWTLLLAGVGLFTTDFLIPALALSAFFLLLTVWLAYGFTFWLTNKLWPAVLAGLGVAFAGRLLWAGLAGMETTAFAALSLAAVWAYSRWGLRPFPALLFGLAGQLRPEGHALFGLALLDTGWQTWQAWRAQTLNWRKWLLQIGPALLIYLLLALPYSLFSLATTGNPLPNTFYAKVGSQYVFSWRTLQETLAFHLSDNPAAFVLAVVGFVPLWRRSRLAFLWLVGLPLLTAVIIDFTWHHGRYTMPLIPFQMTAAAVGAHWLLDLLINKRHLSLAAQRALIGGLFVLLLIGGAWRLSYWAYMHGSNAQEVLDIDVALGRWLAQNTPSDALIAVDDIGAIAFLSERRIVDMNGLVSPQVWPAVRAPEGLPRNQALTRILSASRPDFMVAFPLWRWDIAVNTAVSQPIHHVQTPTHTIIFQQDAYVYQTTWPYLQTASPEHSVEAHFGDGIRLLGYDLENGDMLDLTLYWLAETAVSESYDVFIHLVDEAGNIVLQADQKPLGGLAATDVWQPGDIIRDPLTLTWPQEVPPGTYEMWLGVYLRENGARLPLTAENVENDALLLKVVERP